MRDVINNARLDFTRVSHVRITMSGFSSVLTGAEQQYYSLSDLRILGRCVCHGHVSACDTSSSPYHGCSLSPMRIHLNARPATVWSMLPLAILRRVHQVIFREFYHRLRPQIGPTQLSAVSSDIILTGDLLISSCLTPSSLSVSERGHITLPFCQTLAWTELPLSRIKL